MRKPPGLRLRLRAAGQGYVELRGRLGDICDELRARALCGRNFLSCYEPETFQFGGPHAMEIVHRYFSADTRAWCAHAKLLLRGRALLGAEVLSLAVLNDLFHRTLRGSEDEVWDTWCNLSLVHGRHPQLSDRPLRAPSIEELVLAASPPERRLLRFYEAQNLQFARRLWRAHERGQLLYRMRLILPFVALFHWNRYALVSEQRELICDSMYTRLHTKRGLIAG